MNTQAYYRCNADTGCDEAVAEHFLLVNCSGVYVMSEPFTTHNRRGRKDFYLMYLCNGALEMEVRERRWVAHAGSAILFPPGCPYRYRKKDRDKLIYYWAHFSGSGAGALLERCALPMQTVQEVGVHAEIAEAFQALFRNFISRDECSDISAATKLADICVMVRRFLNGAPSLQTGEGERRLQKSLDHMYHHYRDGIRVVALAQMEHLSVSRYSAVFRQCMGVSPRDFLIDLRMKMAQELLRSTDLSVKQVARGVGYEDPLYFSRLFRAKTGLAPRQYATGRTGARK